MVPLERQTRRRKKERDKAKDETSTTTNAASAKNTETVYDVQAKDYSSKEAETTPKDKDDSTLQIDDVDKSNKECCS